MVRGFGELESVVMDQMWDRAGKATVRDVLEDLQQTRDIAYTTVMTTMDTLHRKGWLDREKHGKAYHYWPTLTREEYSARLMREALDGSEDPDAVLSQFLAQMSDEESSRLRSLMRRLSSRKGAS